ncbi:antibiotic biosynthesis monooxygenase [Mycobacterium sp. pW045]|uniref:antibiotic biosynthesis monooxygenase family protein n=1 Tax=Mycobacterium sp. pW045 TaxID=3238984 RepID=UPI00351AFF9C
MIVEHGVLPIHPGSEADFEAAFAKARPLIAAQPGFLGISMSRSIESPNLYLLLVQWESVAAHTEGFRKSPEFAQWRALLHDFYASPPVIEHFVDIEG